MSPSLFHPVVLQASAVVQPLWPLRFRGCDRGRPVSVSLRAEEWHLTQYPRRIRFLPRSPPSSASVYCWSVSSPCVRGILRRKPLQTGTPTTSKSSHHATPSCQAVPSSEQVLSAVVVQQSYATRSVSADLHGTSKVRGTRRHLSLKDVEPGKTMTLTIWSISSSCGQIMKRSEAEASSHKHAFICLFLWVICQLHML